MDMSSQCIAYAHDAFVRTVMSDPRIAREFYRVKAACLGRDDGICTEAYFCPG